MSRKLIPPNPFNTMTDEALDQICKQHAEDIHPAKLEDPEGNILCFGGACVSSPTVVIFWPKPELHLAELKSKPERLVTDKDSVRVSEIKECFHGISSSVHYHVQIHGV